MFQNVLVWKCCFWLTTNEGSGVAYKTSDMKSHLGQNLTNWKSYMLLSISICSILAIIWTSHQTLLKQFLSLFIPSNLVSLAAVFWMSRNVPPKTSKKRLQGRLYATALKECWNDQVYSDTILYHYHHCHYFRHYCQ